MAETIRPINYLRQLIRETATTPPLESIHLAYANLKRYLPETEFADGYRIEDSLIKDNELLHFPHIGSVISAASGNDSTNVTMLHETLALGPDFYEYPDQDSGLLPDVRGLFIRHNSALREKDLRNRMIKTTSAYYPGVSQEDIEKYINEQCPVGTLWLASAVDDALKRFNELTEGKLLHDGKLIDAFQGRELRILLINADSGAGEIQAHHDRAQGRSHRLTLTDTLVNVQTGLIAKLVGIRTTETIAGACAASGKAIHYARKAVRSDVDTPDLVIVMSMYDGPTVETQQAFREAGISYSDETPYLYNDIHGYTEASGAAVNIFVRASFARELQLPVNKARFVRSATYQGDIVFGADKTIPKETYRIGFKQLQEYYPPDYTGTIIFGTHGANTPGWFLEIKALQELKKEFFPDAQFVITSMQIQMGHSYAPRTSISLETLVESVEEGIVPGIDRASKQLTFVGQDNLQRSRRMQLKRIIGEKISRVRMSWGGKSEKEDEHFQRKAEKLLLELAEANIFISFSTMKIPQNIPTVAVNTGLGAESSFVATIPIAPSQK